MKEVIDILDDFNTRLRALEEWGDDYRECDRKLQRLRELTALKPVEVSK